MSDKIRKEDYLISFIKELSKIQANERLLVILTHGFIELLLNSLIDKHLKHGRRKITSNNRDYPHSVKLVILNELNLIDNTMYGILDWFRKLRNKAAHEVFFEIDKSEYKFAQKSLDRFLPDEGKKPLKHFFDFCTLLVGTIWNENIDVLKPLFFTSTNNVTNV